MATIPIEIILQDAETPVDPTPTPEETNIVVPDTGAGTVGSGSTLTGSSAASIILSVILLAVALATVCTLLIHKHRKHQNNDKLSKKEKLLTATSTTIAVLSATVLVGNLVIPATNAATSVEPGTADLDVADKITITATREADSGEVVATVQNTSYATANLDFGYKVTASMAENATTANLYLDGNTDSPYYIAPVSDGTLTDNTWGYTLSDEAEEYLAIPLADDPNTLKQGKDAVEAEPVDVYYYVKIASDMPVGTYSGELEYSLVALEPSSISDLTYMQDFAGLSNGAKANVLRSMTEGTQYTLIDYRGDDKSYYIAKLADGKVWMTQNLDLDIDENTTYAHADTDLGWSNPNSLDATAKWKPDEGHSTISFTGGTVEGWVDSGTAPYSTDPGDVYYYTTGDSTNEIVMDKEACEEAHPDGSCAHYHAGNYYNWSAAVASNDTSEYGDDDQYTNVETSICPAGWRLPTGKQSGTDGLTNNELETLLADSGVLGPRTGCGSTCYIYADGGFNAIRTAPLWLTRSGYVRDGSPKSAGSTGYYSSSTVNNSAYEYNMYFNSREIEPDNYYGGRKEGYSVRCVVR